MIAPAMRMTSIAFPSREVAGLMERAFYSLVLVMASGPLDHLIIEKALSSGVRAAIWGGIYGGFLLITLRRPSLVGQSLRGAWPLLLLPALAGVSVLWSWLPMQTVTGTLETAAMVVFGGIVGNRVTERQLLGMVILALGAVATVNLWVVETSPIGLDINGDAIGIFSHKNENGAMMTVLLTACLASLVWGGPRFGALLASGLALLLLALSGSRTSWLAALAGTAVVFLLLLRRLTTPAKLAVLLLGCGAGTVLVMVLMATHADVVGSALALLGKDSTLTGRTVLWDLARRYFAHAPYLGHGFNAFWTEDLTSSAAFVNRVMKEDLASFHNGYIEMAIELGIVGAVLQVVLMVWFVQPLHRLLRYGDAAAAAFAAALLVVVVVASSAEVTLFVRHGFHLFLWAALWSRASLLAEAATAPAPQLWADRRRFGPDLPVQPAEEGLPSAWTHNL